MTHDMIQRCQLALEEADTGGDLSYQEIARIVLAASGIAELTEALQGATDLLVEYVGNQVDASVDEYRALLAKIGGKQQPSDEPSQKRIQNRDRPRTFQQDPRHTAMDGECVCGAKSCPQCGASGALRSVKDIARAAIQSGERT